MMVICFDLCKLATMSPEGRYPPHLNNRDTLYLGHQHCQTDNVRSCRQAKAQTIIDYVQTIQSLLATIFVKLGLVLDLEKIVISKFLNFFQMQKEEGNTTKQQSTSAYLLFSRCILFLNSSVPVCGFFGFDQNLDKFVNM